jgi:hypothetical protein
MGFLREGMTLDQFYDGQPHLECQDICDAVTYVLGTPPHVQVGVICSFVSLMLINVQSVTCVLFVLDRKLLSILNNDAPAVL